MACSLFQLTENNVRGPGAPAKRRVIAAEGRGFYRLGPPLRHTWHRKLAHGAKLNPAYKAGMVTIWPCIARVCRAADRAALQRRQQALSLHGFAEFDKGLFIRPTTSKAA